MNNNNPVIIFDMDGVLFDSEPLHVKFEDQYLSSMGVSLTIEQKREFIGLAGYNMWKKLKDMFQLKPSVDDLILADKEMRLIYFIENITTPMPGAEELLRKISAVPFRMALASSSQSDLINLQLSRAGFDKFFEQKVSGYMVNKGKPAPDIFLYTARLMNIEPVKCVVVEDSKNGVTAAKAAGMKCIGYSGFHYIEQDLTGADIIINDLRNVSEEIIRSLVN